MASWPPPPPPHQPSSAHQNALLSVQGTDRSVVRENGGISSSNAPSFPPPPLPSRASHHHPPTESLASMSLQSGGPLPPPPQAHTFQRTSHSAPLSPPPAMRPPPPRIGSSPAPASMPHPHAFHRVSPTHHQQPPLPLGPPQQPFSSQTLHNVPPSGPPAAQQYQQYVVPPPTPYQQQQYQHAPPPPAPYHPPPPGHAPPPQQYPTHQQVRQPPPPIHGRPQNGIPQQQEKPKIDPSKIPRPFLFTRPQDGEAVPIYYPKEALYHDEARPPPAADSRFVTYDDGNAAPQLMRSTVYAIPMDRQTLRHSLDMGLICTPLSIASEDYVPRQRVLPDGSLEEWRDAQRIPIMNMETSSPPRCSRCHAYANPFWNNVGMCNFCNTSQSTQSSIPAMATQYGTVEYQVGGPYVTRSTPVQPISLYALDATCPNLPHYVPMICNVGRAMAEHYRRQGESAGLSPRIGCCLVGSFGIVIAYLEKGTVTLSVVSDITEEPFSPLPLNLWTYDMSTEEGVQQWEMLMEQLWDVWQPFLKQLDQKSPYGPNAFSLSCGGAALAFMADALAPSGGRATLISWRRPNYGVGGIRDREMMNTANYTKEKTEYALYTPLQLQKNLTDKLDVKAAEFYKQLGAACAKNRVCIDVLVHTPPATVPFLDLGTLGELCRITSGKVKWIRSRRWKKEVQEELRRPVLSFVGCDAVFKLRCSEGLQVKSYLSCTAPGVTIENGIAEPELEMSIVYPTSCIAVDLEHRVGGIRKGAQVVYFQSALLYTAPCGRRRVRVSTLALRTTTSPADVFRSADFSAITALMARKTIANLWQPLSDVDAPLQQARVDVTTDCINILSNYRLYTNAYSLPIGQLILPDRLQLLPLYCLSFLKCVMLRSSLPKRGSGVRAVKPSPTADERAYGLFFGSSIVPALSMLFVHPNVFPVLNLGIDDGEWRIPEYSVASSAIEKAAAHAYIQMPGPVNPSITCLGDQGVYLIDDGFTIFVYLGKDVPSDISGSLLVKDKDGNFAVSDASDFGKQIHRLLWQMQTFCTVGEGSESALRPTVAPVEVVIGDENHKDPQEEKILALMVDDSSSSEHDYVDFLVQIHKAVRSKTQST